MQRCYWSWSTLVLAASFSCLTTFQSIRPRLELMRISALMRRALALTIVCLAERDLFRHWWNTWRSRWNMLLSSLVRKYLLSEYSSQNEIKLFSSMLDRTIWIRSLYSTGGILQSFDMNFKTYKSIGVFMYTLWRLCRLKWRACLSKLKVFST